MNTLKMIKAYFFSLLSMLNSSLVSAITVLTAFIAPIGDLLSFVAFLVVVDFISGVVAAKYRGEVRESAKMVKSVYKMFFYIIVLMTAILS